jgi:hypothetical protein
MITKIDDRKIKHQSNVRIFIWDCNNIIESKPKQDYLKIKKKSKNDSIERKKKLEGRV